MNGGVNIINLRERLRQGRSVTGTMVTVFDNPAIAKILKVCGFDFFIVDAEHGSFDYSAIAGILAVAKEAGVPAMVRVPEARREVVLKYMEMGASGILLPNTETVEQAEALVEYAKYYPLGNRGVSLLRAHTGFKKPSNALDYMRKANEETILMIQIESPKGVKNIAQLLDVEGIDASFIGPNDLSQSMGVMGQIDTPKFVEAVEEVIAVTKKKDKFSGIHLMSVAALKPWIDKGMTLNLWSNDVNMLMSSATEALNKLKEGNCNGL